MALELPKFVVIFGLIALVSSPCPALAELSAVPDVSNPSMEKAPLTGGGGLKPADGIVAQTPTAAEISDVAAAGAITGKKLKGELLITDSLWGNLILELAYQRDQQLQKIGRRLNLVNWGTMAAITGIAGGTLAQGIIALSVLNPPPPKSDSYLPGSIGVGFAGLTLVTFAGRTVINQVLLKRLRSRQLEIKHQVESILARFESTRGDNAQARSELVGLIGERAANEWVQLWRSSNSLASLKSPGISLSPSAILLGNRR